MFITSSFLQIIPQESAIGLMKEDESFWSKLKSTLHQILEELAAPPTLAAVSSLEFAPLFYVKEYETLNCYLHYYKDGITKLASPSVLRL